MFSLSNLDPDKPSPIEVWRTSIGGCPANRDHPWKGNTDHPRHRAVYHGWSIRRHTIWVNSSTGNGLLHSCQSQSGVPQITLSCYKALSQQKYKVWSHFPLKPHYDTSRHLMIWFKSVRHTKILHRGSLKAEKIRNFSVMRLHLEKAPQTTQFYNICSINNALINTYKIPSIFLGFSCFLFHDEIFFCVKSTAQKRIYVYRYIFA